MPTAKILLNLKTDDSIVTPVVEIGEICCGEIGDVLGRLGCPRISPLHDFLHELASLQIALRFWISCSHLQGKVGV